MGKHHISEAATLFRGPGQKGTSGDATHRGHIIPDVVYIDFGAVAALDDNKFVTTAIINGAATLVATSNTVPRNVVITGSDTNVLAAIFTITGTDEYGVIMVENITGPASTATTVGLKAFKTISSIVTDTSTVGLAVVGTGNRLGLSQAIFATDNVIVANADAVSETTAPTVVVADTTDPATATDGDVRGTVDFATAYDGSAIFTLLYLVDSTSVDTLFGVAQFGG